MTKISRDTILECVNSVLQASNNQSGNIMEIIELQVVLKGSGPQKDGRFGSSIRLKFTRRQNMEESKFGDEDHAYTAKSLTLPNMEAEALKNFYKSKRLAKNLVRKYDTFMAWQLIMKQIPRFLSLLLDQPGKFPLQDSVQENAVRATGKNQMKKAFRFSIAVGHDDMSPEELAEHLFKTMNFMVSLLKKQWLNVRSLHIKSAMGSPEKLY